jgi:hypothetical protein
MFIRELERLDLHRCTELARSRPKNYGRVESVSELQPRNLRMHDLENEVQIDKQLATQPMHSVLQVAFK